MKLRKFWQSGGIVDVLSYAMPILCSVNPSGRKVGPFSLYPYLHPAKILGNFVQI